MTASSSPFVRFFRFLGKVKFTTVLLLGGAVIMTAGTILESRESREVAWSAIYGTLWFDIFLFLCALNMSIAVINRMPIRRHQWPFVLTHFAIILLLAGAWISGTFGYEGRLVVSEGSESDRIYLDTSEIRSRWQPAAQTHGDGAAVEANFPLATGARLAGRVLQQEDAGRPAIRIREYVENGVSALELVAADSTGAPAIDFVVSSASESVQRWLIADDPRFGRLDLGPLEIAFRRAGPDDSLAEEHTHGEAPRAELWVAVSEDDTPVRIALPAQLGQPVACGPGLVAEVQEFMLRARIVDGKLSEVASAPLNPAAVVAIRSKRGTEIHTVFANFPEFNGVRDRDPERPLVASVRLRASAEPAKPQLAILLGADAQLHAQLENGSGHRHSTPLSAGQDIALEGLGLGFRLQGLMERARPELRVQPASAGDENGAPYVRVEARLNGQYQSLWLRRGSASQIASFAGGAALELAFAPQTRALPFRIALEEFRLERYPGSNRPAQYASHVQVARPGSELAPRAEVISMNRPLDVEGFRLFQSSYQLGQRGGPDTTILTVSYDPGVPIVYISFVLIIVGIAWGLRGVRPKAEPTVLARRGDRVAPQRPSAKTKKRARRAQLRAPLGLLLAALAGLAPWVASRAQADAQRLPVEATQRWAILVDGRVKPLLTFANETALTITGREHFDDLNALEILWGYVLASQDFAKRPYLRIDSMELKAALGLSSDAKRFSFDALMGAPRFRPVVEQALTRQRQEQPLSRLDKDALDAYGKLSRMAGLMSGEALSIVPLPDESGAWRSLQSLHQSQDPAEQAIDAGMGRLARAYASGDAEAFGQEARSLESALRELNPALYPSAAQIDRELFYESFNAFGKAWKLYLIGFLLLMVLGFSERPWAYVAGTLLIGAGFLCHTIGVGTRWAIAGRAPVSDMYESLVFMGWGVIAFGLVTEAIYRKRFIALAAGLAGFLCLSFAENLPIDSSINPLVPVLAHTSWLSIHVMTIMLSYSALALAMVIGHASLFVEVFQRHKVLLLSSLSKVLYKILQIGVLFLAAGIIFGAIWANESWGRYWGWDPKETWSLITLFLYLAIVHARFAGWLGHFGLAASAIIGFLAVLMTYYGVNFILAAGLHSYGFSEGGRIYAALYTIVELAIVGGALLRHRATTASLRAGLGLPGSEPRPSTHEESLS
ncbi:MAG: cytochrome c biogenesis protein CcsA [Myxococcales bacterium]|nr:cytochrome c biogenesis protein CcsA [Myxococcales bacterium]MDH5306109.1 cytochrome c biogenesis protein CcsA [Myxococcales bacterium]MDH5566368.1 cytochrome c biogenesis protein CcsA [Myxococcales bacterium]